MLERAGLISRSRSGQWRSSSLEAGRLREVLDWVEPYRRLWDDRLDRLEAHLRRQAAAPSPPTSSPQVDPPSGGHHDERQER